MVISIASPSNHQHIDGQCQLSFSITLFDFSTDIPISDIFNKFYDLKKKPWGKKNCYM